MPDSDSVTASRREAEKLGGRGPHNREAQQEKEMETNMNHENNKTQ